MRVALTSLLTAALLLAASSPLLAGSQDNAVVALHSQPHTTKAISTCPGTTSSLDPNTQGIPCDFYVTESPVFTSRDVYLVVARADPVAGIAGLSCGVEYSFPVGIFGWTLCADLDFPNVGVNGPWPASRSGNRITWAASANCQRTELGTLGVHAVAGAFYVYAYSDGLLEITENPNLVTPEFRVADCNASESDVQSPGGMIGFGSVQGYNPCWIIDCGCEIFPSSGHTCCCGDGFSYEPDCRRPAEQQQCLDEGGTLVVGPCSANCAAICEAVAAQRTTWGRLKTRY